MIRYRSKWSIRWQKISLRYRVGALSQHWDNLPVIELEGFELEITEGNRLIEIRAVNALE